MTIQFHEYLAQQVRQLRQSFRYNPSSHGSVDDWQSAFRAKLRDLLEPWPTPADSPAPQWEQLEARSAYNLHRVTYAVEPGLETFALVAIPHRITQPQPGVIAIHGHGNLGANGLFDWRTPNRFKAEVANHKYDYGHRLAEAGFVVWAPNLRGFGERLTERQLVAQTGGRDMCDMTFWQQQAIGQTALTGQIHELAIAVDLLASLEQVDPRRIGCAGLSYGGRMTMYLAALDQRIKACIVSGALNSFVERIAAGGSCAYQIAPGLLKCGDVGDILGLIAPRPLALELGTADSVCPPREHGPQYQFVRSVYAAARADDKLVLMTFDGGHAFEGAASIPWLKANL